MHASMMSMPLSISSIIEHADRSHGSTQVVSRRFQGHVDRMDYRTLHARARRLARALQDLGIGAGDRVATLAWNGSRHLELYFAVSGCGAVLHTINPRLHPEQIAWIAKQAQDVALFFDVGLGALATSVQASMPGLSRFVAMCATDELPVDGPAGQLCYEDLLDASDETFHWPTVDENQASSLCFTSGTTGDPKGVLYSHRSTVLHALACALPDALNLSARDTIAPIVPMFHVNAWGLPYAAPMVGARLVLPGSRLDGASLYELFESESVTVSAGVPTVWQGILAHMEEQGLHFSKLRRAIIGGSACPPSLRERLEDRHGVQVTHAWGMTELSPLGTVASLKAHHLGLDQAARRKLEAKQGRSIYPLQMKITAEDGRELAWDGRSSGELWVKGPWVVDRYFPSEPAAREGWFATGDIATIDEDGFMQITDRTKDLIKSGGEWISSILLEHIAMSHPDIAAAACIGVAHPKWDERPLLIVACRQGRVASREDLLAFFAGKVARWQCPDDVVFVDTLPTGATGKVQKMRLREHYRDHRWPEP